MRVRLKKQMDVVCIDAVKFLMSIPCGVVQLVVTSPPYGLLRTYDNPEAFTWEKFKRVACQLRRVLCDGGVICWVVADSVENGFETTTTAEQRVFFDALGLKTHDSMIYAKSNFSHPEKTRYHNLFEYIFVLSKGKPRCFNPIKDKKNATAGAVGNLGVNTFTERDGSKSERSKKITAEFGMRGNVWTGNTRGQEEMCKKLNHPAMMPKWLARDLIISWSNPGDLVLDPFLGSGTTLVEAKKLGRKIYGCDVNPDYCKIAVENLKAIC